MTTEEKTMRDRLAVLQEKEAELMTEIAIDEHPELKETIEEIREHAGNILKLDAQKDKDLTKTEQKKKESLAKKLEKAEEKFTEAQKNVLELREEMETKFGVKRGESLKLDRELEFAGLKNLLMENRERFKEAGLTIEMAVPELVKISLETDESEGPENPSEDSPVIDEPVSEEAPTEEVPAEEAVVS